MRHQVKNLLQVKENSVDPESRRENHKLAVVNMQIQWPEAKLTKRQNIVGTTELLEPIEKISFKNFACKRKKRNQSEIRGRRRFFYVGNLPVIRESSRHD